MFLIPKVQLEFALALSAPRPDADQQLRAIAQFPPAEEELIEGRFDEGRKLTDLATEQFTAQFDLAILVKRSDQHRRRM